MSKGKFVAPLWVATLMVALAASQSARAQSPADKATARHLMDAADRMVEEKRFADALKAYEGAHAIMHVPTTGIEVAKTLAELGRLVDARQAAYDVTRMPPADGEPKAFAAARKEAAELEATLAKRIPTLVVEPPGGIEVAQLRVTVDGEAMPNGQIGLPYRLDPGRRVLRVDAPGHPPFVRELTLGEGTTTTIKPELEGRARSTAGPVVSPSTSPLGLPPLAIAGLGAAALGVGVGTITGIVSLDQASTAKDKCGPDPKNCDPAAESAIDASKTYGWVSTVSFAIAIAGASVATYALFFDKDAKTGGVKRVDLNVSANGASIRGTF
jgi:hypothetical protein